MSVGVDAKLQILVDPLSVFMILVVSGVSTLIHLYSVTYMKLDRGINRYFSYLNYFVFSMLLLVLAGNFVLLIVGWAFVGAASYLLISFWYRRTTATRAGIKAFVINVVGDVGLVIATFILFQHTGTVQFLGVFHAVPHTFAHNGDADRRRRSAVCSSARSPSPPRCRSTPGSPTPWRAPRRCRR